MRKIFGIVAILAFMCGTSVFADTLKKGNKELSFSFSYDDVKLKNIESEGNFKTYNLLGSFGYLITDGNEAGINISYNKTELPVIADRETKDTASFDSIGYGFFYNYNFKAGDMCNPYLGAQVQGFSGDFGDYFNWSYGATAGVKIYPWSNGGFNFGARYDWVQGQEDIVDSTDLRFFAGVNVKW